MNAVSKAALPLIELDLLKTLVAISETGNFSAAAAEVYRTPSAVSMQVKRLEELIGKPVFNRDSRSVSLTTAGEALLVHARRVLALNREMVAKFITPDVAGVVRMGAPDDVAERMLPMMLRRFAESHPCVTVDVVVENSAVLCRMIDEARLDMAVVTCDTCDGAGSRKPEVLLYEKLVWACLKNGIAAEKNPLPISVWEEGCVWRRAGIDSLDSIGRDYRVAFQSANISGQKAAILADLVVAPVPVNALSGDIVEVPRSYGLPELPEYSLGLIMAESPNEPVKAAADHLRASFSDKDLAAVS